MPSLLISDLHLQEDRPDLTQALRQFLATTALEADRLFILGDLFEVWIGDDDLSDFNLSIIALLRQYADTERDLFIMGGNRDFLMGEDLANRCGATYLNDPQKLELHGVATLLMHGDSLCTRDTEYMAFREQSRTPQWRSHMLSQPLSARREFARNAREQSQRVNRMKSDDIMDVTPEDVARTFEEQQITRMIHGHTHRPDRHSLPEGERIVLGDWDTDIWWLNIADDGAADLVSIPLQDYLAS